MLTIRFARGSGSVLWGRIGREFCYRSGQCIIGVSIDASGAGPPSGAPTPPFADEYDFGFGISIPNYDDTSDGRFITLRRGASRGAPRVVIHWAEELQRMLDSGGR